MADWFLIVWLGAMPVPTHQYVIGPMTWDECHSLDVTLFSGAEENARTRPWYAASQWQSNCIAQFSKDKP